MKFLFHLTCLALALTSVNSYAQDTSPLSLPELWSQALSNYPSVEAYRAQHREAEINERAVRSGKIPELSLQVQNTMASQNAVNGAFFPLPGIYNVNGEGVHPANTFFGSAVMDWSFLQFGKQKKSQEAAAILTHQAQQRVEVEELKIRSALSRAYFALSFNEAMVAWARLNTERLEGLLQAAKSRADAGLVPGADSLLIKATLDQARSELHSRRGSRDESKIVVSQWVNVSPQRLAIRLAPAPNVTDIHALPTDNSITHPQLTLVAEQVRHAEKQQELSKVQGLPNVSLLAGIQLRGASAVSGNLFDAALAHDYQTVHNYAIGIGLTWNPTNAVRSAWEVRRHKEQVKQMRSIEEEVALSLRSQDAYARGQLQEVATQIERAEESYRAAMQAYALFEARYNSGLISITELLQIQDLVQTTDRARIEAHHQYWLHQVNLAEAIADFSWLQENLQ